MPRNTPTPSECDEIQDGYLEAWYFWVAVQCNLISKKRYIATADRFDDLPGVSGYFRFLCLHDLVYENGLYRLHRVCQ